MFVQSLIDDDFTILWCLIQVDCKLLTRDFYSCMYAINHLSSCLDTDTVSYIYGSETNMSRAAQ